MLVAGLSRASALWLIAISLSALGAGFFLILRRRFGIAPAIAAAVALCAVPVVAWSVCLVMVDISSSMVAFFAVLAFVHFANCPSWRRSALFGVLAAAAILTKNSSYYILLVPGLYIVAGSKWSLLKVRSFWLAPILVVGLYGPWLLISRSALLVGTVGLDLPSFWGFTGKFLAALWRETSFLLIPATVGAFFVLRRRKEASALELCLLATVPASLVAVVAARVPVQERLFIVVYMAVIFFALLGLTEVLSLMRVRSRIAVNAVLVLFFGVYIKLNWMDFRRPPQNDMRQAVEFINRYDVGQSGAILVSSAREGPWIAEFVQSEDSRPKRIFVRPTKVFCDESWNATGYRPLLRTVDELSVKLDELPVRYVIRDSTQPSHDYLHDHLLDQLIQAHPDLWKKCFVSDGSSPAGYVIYQNMKWSPDSQSKLYAGLKKQFLSKWR
ncbi:ArnT family glycosyltransferase [Paludibaculum fermentans]|uniref:Glycosyltransferase family 39 protein n=1 Tax=Paludibaculum fermentans TaxID=1473598 RepID=A0A7S7NYW0_PALFE|nr:glycosyltransferase family 39 protein [Paludibaculum fermentans]QOY92310.1 glycosyltransferase family 39 protein [Paludibaculum fermentans]